MKICVMVLPSGVSRLSLNVIMLKSNSDKQCGPHILWEPHY